MLCQGNSCFMWNQNDGPMHMWQTCRIRIKQHPTLCTHLNGIRHCPDTLVPLGGEGDAASITPTPLTHQHQLGLVQIGANKKSQRSELYEQLQLQRVSGENPKELVHITYPVLSVKEAADWPKKKNQKHTAKANTRSGGKCFHSSLINWKHSHLSLWRLLLSSCPALQSSNVLYTDFKQRTEVPGWASNRQNVLFSYRRDCWQTERLQLGTKQFRTSHRDVTSCFS